MHYNKDVIVADMTKVQEFTFSAQIDGHDNDAMASVSALYGMIPLRHLEDNDPQWQLLQVSATLSFSVNGACDFDAPVIVFKGEGIRVQVMDAQFSYSEKGVATNYRCAVMGESMGMFPIPELTEEDKFSYLGPFNPYTRRAASAVPDA